MKKRYKLKNGGRILLSIIVVIVSAVLYSKAATFGKLAQTNVTYELICVGAWMWLMLGQFVVLSFIWDK